MKLGLIGCAAVTALIAVTSVASAQDSTGAVMYREHCRSCHGVAGVPPQRMLRIYPSLRALDSTFLAPRSVDSLVAGLSHGVGAMKPFKDKLTPAQLRAVSEYVLTFAHPARRSP